MIPIPTLVLAMVVVLLAGCGRESEDSPDAAATTQASGGSAVTPDGDIDPPNADREESDEDDPESDGLFARAVSILPTAPLIRRPEDELTVRLRHSTRAIIYPVPNGWEPEPAEEGADWADQIRVPAPFTEDYGDGFVTIYHSDDEEIDDILNRWLLQIDHPAFTPEIRELDFVDGTPLLVTEFVGVGTYDPGEIEPREEMMVIGAVVEGGPEGTLIFKGVGPRALMEAQRYRWSLLLRSMKLLRHGAGQDGGAGQPQ